MPKEGLPRNTRAREDTKDYGIHFSTLFDEDNDRAGERIDPATGKRINNSHAVSGADEILHIVDTNASGDSEDALGPIPDDEDDEAAKWLRETTKH